MALNRKRTSRANVLAFFGSLAVHGAVFGVIAGTAGPLEKPEDLGSGRWAGELFMISTESPVFSGIGSASENAGAPEETSAEKAPAVEAATAKEAVVEKEKPEVLRGDEAAFDSAATNARPPRASPAKSESPSVRSSEALLDSSSSVSRSKAAPPTDASSAPRGSSGESGGGTFGSEGATLELGKFPDAFTRVLPVAAQGLHGIYEAQIGTLGRFIVRVSVDEEGKLVSLVPTKTPAAVFVSLLRSTQILLRSGRFALPAGSRGEFLVGLDVSVSEEASEATDGDAPLASAVRGLSHTRPNGKEPGIALVRYASGKKITLLVDPEPNPKEY